MRVIIFDSNRKRLADAVKHAKKLNMDVTAVSKADSVKKTLMHGTYDLLILDDAAVTLIGALKKFDTTIPIVVMAEADTHLNYQKLFQNGVAGLIVRPYTAHSFRQVVRKAIAQRQNVLDSLQTVTSLKRKIRELSTLSEIVQAINSSLKPEEILETIMAKAADLIKAEGWSVLLLDYETRELVFKATAGEAGKKLLGMRLKIGQGVAGWAARHGQSLIVPDVSKDPRFYSGIDAKTKFVTKSILCVPMRSKNKIIGVVEVVNKSDGEPFTNDDLEIFENLVAHVTIALENAAIYRKMEEASLIDDLTKLYNLRYCNQYLDKFLAERKSEFGIVSLIFLDIDFFKLVDDNFGHLVGSETLRRVGERLRRTVRKNDVLVRYGGDEYIVILPNTDKQTATAIAERIRKEIAREPFFTFDNQKFSISVTLGVATYPEDAKTRDELIGKADKAMYDGKLSGRDKVVVA